MNKKQVYRGTVKTGRDGGAIEMSKPGVMEQFTQLTGLSVIPGTLNIKLAETFDLSRLKYLKFTDAGWDFDPDTQRIPYKGEIGMHYGRVTVAGKYPAFLIFFTWVTNLHTDAELVSPHHLRSILNLRDGDVIEFTLTDK